MNRLEDHHLAWLMAHPHRSSEWLKNALKDGFDVHHMDGDHSNNDPSNLILIEHVDHMGLHGGRTLGRLKRPAGPGRKKKPRPNAVLGNRHNREFIRQMFGF
jgi:hypothetical protein